MFPNAIVRTVTDGSLGVSGPRLQGMLKDDPWGTVGARIPNWDKYPLDETDPEGLLRLAPNGIHFMLLSGLIIYIYICMCIYSFTCTQVQIVTKKK